MPLARKVYFMTRLGLVIPVVVMSIAVVSKIAGSICVAINRHQMRLYSFHCWGARCVFNSSGWSDGLAGRIASCASCAPFDLVLNRRGVGTAEFSPKCFAIVSRAGRGESLERL